MGERLGANPAEVIINETGQWSLRFLLFTLAVTPFLQITGWYGLNIRYNLRRLLGLYAFFYASLHVLSYLLFDHSFDWLEIVNDLLTRPALSIGLLVFILMIPLAVTSHNRLIKQLGQRQWKRLHQLIYPISIGAVLHLGWLAQAKADLRESLLYAAILAGLLLLRYPPLINRLSKKGVTSSEE